MIVTTVPVSAWTIAMNGSLRRVEIGSHGRRRIRFGDSNRTISRPALGGILQQRHIRIEILRRLGDVDALSDQHMIPRAYAGLHGVSHVGDQPLMDSGPLRRLFKIRVHSRKRIGHGHDLLDSAKHSLRWASRPRPFLQVLKSLLVYGHAVVLQPGPSLRR